MNNNFYKDYLQTPIGILEIISDDIDIYSINFIEKIDEILTNNFVPNIIKKCKTQLEKYFEGKKRIFNIKINMTGTDFQKKVLKELLKINYGEKATYSDLAKKINNSKAQRAIGNALHKNKIPIIIPCHRVIGKNGNLTGYAGGIWRKERLLFLEDNYRIIIRKAEKYDIYNINNLLSEANDLKIFIKNNFFQENIINKKENFCYIAENKNNDLLGLISLSIKGKINLIYVKKEYQKQDIGTLLLNYISKIAYNLTLKEITVETNSYSKNFFEKNDFYIINEYFIKTENENNNFFLMKKDLKNNLQS